MPKTAFFLDLGRDLQLCSMLFVCKKTPFFLTWVGTIIYDPCYLYAKKPPWAGILSMIHVICIFSWQIFLGPCYQDFKMEQTVLNKHYSLIICLISLKKTLSSLSCVREGKAQGCGQSNHNLSNMGPRVRWQYMTITSPHFGSVSTCQPFATKITR